jgi:hypothetical protein
MLGSGELRLPLTSARSAHHGGRELEPKQHRSPKFEAKRTPPAYTRTQAPPSRSVVISHTASTERNRSGGTRCSVRIVGDRWPVARHARPAWPPATTVCVASNVAEAAASGPATDSRCWTEAVTPATSPLPSSVTTSGTRGARASGRTHPHLRKHKCTSRSAQTQSRACRHPGKPGIEGAPLLAHESSAV